MTDLLNQAITQVKQLSEAEQDYIAQVILTEVETKITESWDELDDIIKECQISTGIKDLSYQHDHYIHENCKQLCGRFSIISSKPNS